MHKTPALSPDVFLTGIYGLLITNKGRSPEHRANHCQGQLQNSTVSRPVY